MTKNENGNEHASHKASHHAKHSRKKKPKTTKIPKTGIYVAIGVLALIVIVLIIVFSKGGSTQPSGKLNIDLYVMSQCPYGIQA